MENSNYESKNENLDNEIILRDRLAIDRTKLANQRTLLAYLRTSLIFLGTSVTLFQLFTYKDILFYVAILSMVFSSVFLIIGIVVYKKVSKNISSLYKTADKKESSV